MTILPADIVNRALDSIGASKQVIGDFSDGTPISEAARRVYGEIVRQMLRAAHWNFARKWAPLQLLADATGNTRDPGTGAPISAATEPPWIYAYAWPIDGVGIRWLPMAPVSGPPADANGVPVTTSGAPPNIAWPLSPAQFLVSTSDEFNDTTGQVDWSSMPDLHGTIGVGLLSRQIILTNVPNAAAVYTALVTEIELWDALYSQAVVAATAERLAPVAHEDPKAAMTWRAAQIGVAKQALIQARVVNGNEGGFPQSTDHVPNWIRARSGGLGGAWGWGPVPGPGYLWYPWQGYAFGDGSVF